MKSVIPSEGTQSGGERQGALVIVFLLLLVASFAFDGWKFVQVLEGDQALLSADAMRWCERAAPTSVLSGTFPRNAL